MDTDVMLTEKFASLFPHLDERQRRLYAAAEARALGHGGISRVARASGLSRPTIYQGLRDLDGTPTPARVRRAGAGRPAIQERDPALPAALDALIEPTTRGDPEAPLRWTCKSTRQLGRCPDRPGPPGQPQCGGRPAAGGRLQSASPRQDAGGQRSS